MRAVLFAVACLLVVPAAAAHGAPEPRDHETRLLADCNDDWFGSDSAIGERVGYDIHSLDVREAWVNGKNALFFRLILNGEGPADITLRLTMGQTVKRFTWNTADGSTWDSTGFETERSVRDFDDGERFALEGRTTPDALGIQIGGKINDYAVIVRVDGDEKDRMPGYDGGPLGECDPPSDPTSYKRGTGYQLVGPTVYTHFPARDAGDCRAGTPPGKQTATVGDTKFIDLVFCNRLGDQAQEFTLTVTGPKRTTLRFHDPASGQFQERASTALQADQGTLIHLAVSAEAPVSGTATVTLTTNLGGRAVMTIPIEITDPGSTDAQTTTQGGDNATPAPWLATLALLWGLAAWRRR